MKGVKVNGGDGKKGTSSSETAVRWQTSLLLRLLLNQRKVVKKWRRKKKEVMTTMT